GTALSAGRYGRALRRARDVLELDPEDEHARGIAEEAARHRHQARLRFRNRALLVGVVVLAVCSAVGLTMEVSSNRGHLARATGYADSEDWEKALDSIGESEGFGVPDRERSALRRRAGEGLLAVGAGHLEAGDWRESRAAYEFVRERVPELSEWALKALEGWDTQADAEVERLCEEADSARQSEQWAAARGLYARVVGIRPEMGGSVEAWVGEVDAAREQAAREQAARERAARDQAAREQAAREQAAREQAAREQAAREQAARERVARVERDMDLVFVEIPAGSFTMGSASGESGRGGDEKQHRVTLTRGFSMSATEVTQAQWKSVMGSNPSHFKGGALPVEKVSWFDAVKFCNALSERAGLRAAYQIHGESVKWDRDANGYRLPTEAEWEYACRAGTETRFSSGNGDSDLERVGWYYGNSREKSHEVAAKPPNAWGLYDMHGNVWEWCWDWYGGYPGSVTDPAGPDSGSYRVDRGGGWFNNAWYCRSANRGWIDPGYRDRYLGFRLSRSAF
ncbi:MAG: SUMF1/EgtB/PvdO family nonheme iron enzyme, partial [Gemmatimonadota bacterium]|nr:SUMF1/EgtB/PvdO family nonheme iron enzyme [Gemmatimonadota bacterium]